MSDYISTLKKQHYRVFNHSAVKLCHWLRKSLKDEGACYKQKFYGIQSHRCLQMTPNIYCPQRCVYCWRAHEFEPAAMPRKWDDPAKIAEESIAAQRKLLEGYYGALDKINKKKLDEAQNPTQVALSLTGEPTAYPRIDDLFAEYHARGATTFLVTNGLYPEKIEKWDTLPTQFYLSISAPNEKIHKKINIPHLTGSWQRINKTLSLMPSLGTRKVIRITLVSGWNNTDPEGYASLIKKSEADFVEVKAYMFVGYSRQRLQIENMPRHAEVAEFARQINEYLNYDFVDEQPESRVVLYSSGAKPAKFYSSTA